MSGLPILILGGHYLGSMNTKLLFAPKPPAAHSFTADHIFAIGKEISLVAFGKRQNRSMPTQGG